MKFKQTAKQNQRIERITGDHIIIGIDIAKFNHVARATDFRGIERGKHLVFSNDLNGFEKLQTWIESLKFQFNKTHVILGVEPTGHYWLNLLCGLRTTKWNSYWLIRFRLNVTKKIEITPQLRTTSKMRLSLQTW